jgi:hypothetical protein
MRFVCSRLTRPQEIETRGFCALTARSNLGNYGEDYQG